MKKNSIQRDKLDYKSELYTAFLSEIKNINFTVREIEIISCIIHQRNNKKIAEILAISYKTVETHIRNIIGKINKFSREDIIDFVEDSGKIKLINELYLCLTLAFWFERYLTKVSALGLYCNKSLSVKEIVSQGTEHDNIQGMKVLKKLRTDLKKANVILEESSFLPSCYYEITMRNGTENINFLIHVSGEQDEQLKSSKCIDFTLNYYIATFSFLEHITSDPRVIKITDEFKDKHLGLSGLNTNLLGFRRKNRFFLKKKHAYCIFVLFLISLPIGYLTIFQQQPTQRQRKVDPSTIVQKSNIDKNKNSTNITYNLPTIENYFVKRKEITKKILFSFQNYSNKDRVVVGIFGPSGIGKSSIAKYIIKNPMKHYEFRGWFNGSIDSLKYSYSELGEQHGLFPSNIPEDKKIAKVKEWISQKKNKLLVYDEVEDIDDIKDFLTNSGDILITSTSRKFPICIEIKEMKEKEAINLIDSLIPDAIKEISDHKAKTKVLVRMLGYFPLALSQAGAYISQNMTSVQEYIDIYNYEKTDLLSQQVMPPLDQHKPIYVSWDINIEKIKNSIGGQGAIKILSMIGYLNNSKIPRVILEKFFHHEHHSSSKHHFNQSINLLEKYSIVRLSLETISTNELVIAWIMSKKYVHDEKEHLNKIISIIKDNYPWTDKKVEDFDFIKLLLPHAEKLLSESIPLLQKIEYVDIMRIIANIHYTLGEYEKSKKILHSVLDIQRHNETTKTFDIIYTLHTLGKLHYRIKDYNQSEYFYNQASQFQNKNPQKYYLNIPYDLAKLKIETGQYIKSKKLLEEAWLIEEKNSSSTSVKNKVRILAVMGEVELELGNYDNSRNLLQSALDKYKNNFKNEHLKISDVLKNIGLLEYEVGDFILSNKLLQEALLIQEKHFGVGHFNTVNTMIQLAKIKRQLFEYDQSKSLLKKALSIEKQSFNFENSTIAYILHHLGDLELKIGNYNKSKKLLEKSLSIKVKYFGLDHIKTSSTLTILGMVELELGNYDKSKHLINQSYSIKEKYFGRNHMSNTHNLNALGNLSLQLGEYDKSRKFLCEALSIKEKHFGSNHINITNTLELLGSLELAIGNYDQSRTFLQKSLSIKHKHFNKGHVSTMRTLKILSDLDERILGGDYKSLSNNESIPNVVLSA